MQEAVKPESGILPGKAGTGVSASSVVGCNGAVMQAGITATIFNWTALCFRALGGREMFVLQQLCHPCLLDKANLGINSVSELVS